MAGWVGALLAVTLLGVSGCTAMSAGNPLPPKSTEGGPTTPTTGGASSTSDAAATLAAIDPCSLLTQTQLDQYGLRRRDSGDVAGARTCSWDHPADVQGKGSFNLKPGIWDRQGLKDINTRGYSLADVVIGRHQARQAAQAGGNGCFIAIGVTESSRVDVAASGDPGQGCVLANQFATLIEPQLPGGR